VPTTGGRKASVLVVDDLPDAADSLALLLTLCSFTARAAYRGADALSMLSAEPADAVVSNLWMPRMDGWELARRVRALAVRPVVLVAVTGLGGAADRARSAEAGFDAHLVKPVDPDALVAFLRHWLGSAGE
jgi:DNA-binding response OmpR family regulator